MKFFITGISTDVGKTIAAAILTEALEADYWKPVQAGDLHNSDSDKVRNLISNKKTTVHENSYALNTPASPHFAAQIDNVFVSLDKIVEPETRNHLIIEGAGGLLVPLNDNDSIIDLIKPDYRVIVVARNYLGSINHTLLTIESLRTRNIEPAGIIFSGEPNAASEEIILLRTQVRCIGRIEQEPFFDRTVVADYAEQFRDTLLNL